MSDRRARYVSTLFTLTPIRFAIWLFVNPCASAVSTAPASVPYKHSWRPGFDYNLISGGWGYPPRDYDRWSELCFQLTKHLIERYGEAEVRRWWFETWNEPNGPAYWKASREEFYKLHDYAIAGVRRALPSARVGGPHTAGHGGPYMEGFLDHITQGKNHATGEQGTPTDVLAFHAKGAPNFVDGHVRMGIKAHLATIDTGFRMIAARPASLSRLVPDPAKWRNWIAGSPGVHWSPLHVNHFSFF